MNLMNNNFENDDFELNNSKDDESKRSNGWQELLPYISTELIKAYENFYDDVELIPTNVIAWFKNNATDKEWFNHFLLAAIMYAKLERSRSRSYIGTINSFLNYAIPKHFPDLKSLIPAKAFISASLEIKTSTWVGWMRSYQQYQFLIERFLLQDENKNNEEIKMFQLPKLVMTKRLSKLRTKNGEEAKRRRKKNVAGIYPEWDQIIEKSLIRYQWMKLFDSKLQEVKTKLSSNEIELPYDFEMPNFDGEEKPLVFRCWNQYHWILDHAAKFSPGTIYKLRYKDKNSTDLFIQFIGDIPKPDWFLESIKLGAIQGPQSLSKKVEKYLRKRGIPLSAFYLYGGFGINKALVKPIHYARETCNGSVYDSNIIFAFEPLMIMATIGIFCLIIFSTTAMRIGEAQQVSVDRNCMRGLYLAQFDDETNNFTKCEKPRYLWYLYPKGHKNKREPFEVDNRINGLLKEYLDLHKRYLGYPIQKIRPNIHFTHIDKYPGKYRFILQWGGHHISNSQINAALSFITINHGFGNTKGSQINISSHLIRHVVATNKNKNGVPLEVIQEFLIHLNDETSQYYSELPFEDLVNELKPILDSMSDEIQFDPTSLRNIDDVKQTIIEVIKKYGALRKIPGGICTSNESCKRLFLCARCAGYIPEFTKDAIDQILQLIDILEQGVKEYEKQNMHLEAKKEREHIKEWKLILAEIELAIKTINLPTENDSSLSDFLSDDEDNDPPALPIPQIY